MSSKLASASVRQAPTATNGDRQKVSFSSNNYEPNNDLVVDSHEEDELYCSDSTRSQRQKLLPPNRCKQKRTSLTCSSSLLSSLCDKSIRYIRVRKSIISYISLLLFATYAILVVLMYRSNRNHAATSGKQNRYLNPFDLRPFLTKFLHNYSTNETDSILSSEYLVYTSTCRIRAQPLFDDEIRKHYRPKYDRDYECDKRTVPFKIERVNFTSIRIDPDAISADKNNWTCYAVELYHREKDDYISQGKPFGPLAEITDFARLVKNGKNVSISGPDRWDVVEVRCSKWNSTKNGTDTHWRVVPLVQRHQARTITTKKPSVNIIALGLDSVSRLNFHRQLPAVGELLEREGFIPLYGYHKVGENSFPNLVPMLTGRHGDYFYNDSFGREFRFDKVPMIFAEASKRGYVTTFVEDMAPYGTFAPGRGGFVRQPTDYYLRPANIPIWKGLYSYYICYQDDIEEAIYWSWLLDAFDAFRQRQDQRHFTFAHMSTLTHNYFNYAGYADQPYSRFLERLFATGVHRNSVMILYSDHAIRFGPFVNTSASIHEARLPFIYVYVPETLRLGPLDAAQIRAILRSNQHRLTSHFDLHATFRHVLHANDLDYRADQFYANDEPYGRSLFAPIAENRTCEQAGIRPQYCTCFGYKSISISRQVSAQTNQTIAHINSLLAPHSALCFDLKLDAIYRAFSAYDPVTGNAMRLIHFRTKPNKAIFETILSRRNSTNAKKHRNYSTNGDSDDDVEAEDFDFEIINISRLDRYGWQSACVSGNYTVEQFCYCRPKTASTAFS